MASKIRKGDKVFVRSGRSKGVEGEVLRVFPERARAIVAGVHRVKRHTKATRDTDGGIIEKELPVPLSILMVLDPKDGKPVRVGFQVKDGKKVRYAKRSGETIAEPGRS